MINLYLFFHIKIFCQYSIQVTRSEDVVSSFRQVQGEIPGSPIFVMKMAAKARHLEVQLLADKHGQVIHLFIALLINLSTIQYLTIFFTSRRSH